MPLSGNPTHPGEGRTPGLESSSRGCPQGWWHVPSTLFPPCPAGAGEGEPGLPQGFSITGAAPGPSSLLLLSIRGETGRAERSLCLALLHGFLSCLSPTDLVPSVSPAARQPCRGRWVGAGLAQPGGIAGTRWWHPMVTLTVPGGPAGGGGHRAEPGVVSIQTGRGSWRPSSRGTGMVLRVHGWRSGERKKGCGWPLLSLPSFLLSLRSQCSV